MNPGQRWPQAPGALPCSEPIGEAFRLQHPDYFPPTPRSIRCKRRTPPILTGRAAIGRNRQERRLPSNNLTPAHEYRHSQGSSGTLIDGQDWADRANAHQRFITPGCSSVWRRGWSFSGCIAGCRLAGLVASRTGICCWSWRARGLSGCAATTPTSTWSAGGLSVAALAALVMFHGVAGRRPGREASSSRPAAGGLAWCHSHPHTRAAVGGPGPRVRVGRCRYRGPW